MSATPASSLRKQQILAAAADQFRTLGYHNVGIDDIADRLGLTGPALYRHFRGKQDVLDAAVASAVDEFATVYGEDGLELRELLEAIADVSVRRRSSVVLWLREARHLPDDRRRTLRARFRRSLVTLRAKIAAARPDLADDDVDLLVWACQTVFASPGYSDSKLEPGRVASLLANAAMAVCLTARLPAERQAPALLPRRRRLLPASRREAALVAATRLFAERGFQRVSMDDIGAAAGIAGPSLYHHFPSKATILTTQLTRCLEALAFDLVAPLDVAESPGQALDLLLTSVARMNLEHDAVFLLLLNEAVNLPAEDRNALERRRSEYVDEWVSLLARQRPELSAAEASVLANATLIVTALLARREAFRKRPGFAADLVTLGRGVLGPPAVGG